MLYMLRTNLNTSENQELGQTNVAVFIEHGNRRQQTSLRSSAATAAPW